MKLIQLNKSELESGLKKLLIARSEIEDKIFNCPTNDKEQCKIKIAYIESINMIDDTLDILGIPKLDRNNFYIDNINGVKYDCEVAILEQSVTANELKEIIEKRK